MKRLITLLLVLLPTLLPAQEKNTTVRSSSDKDMNSNRVIPVLEHMRFKSVEINGPVDKFCSELEKKGFDYENNTLTGLFAGFIVKLDISSTPLSKTTYGVRAYFPQHSTVKDALNDYYLIKDNLCSVYGKPVSNQERYLQPYTDGDGYSMKALCEGKAIFFSTWITETGKISCSIIPSDNNALLLLSYIDSTNEDINIKEKKIIIQRDL